MGDATYNHIYNGTDSTSSVTQRLRTDSTAHHEGDAQQHNSDGQQAGLRDGSVSPSAAGEGGIDALHEAIVSNTAGSAAMVQAGSTPTGDSASSDMPDVRDVRGS